MKFLFNDNVFDWRMTGIIGKNAKWFLGFSRNPRNSSPLPEKESQAKPKESEGTNQEDGVLP